MNDYVTQAERHDGRHVAIIEARRRGMQGSEEASEDGGLRRGQGDSMTERISVRLPVKRPGQSRGPWAVRTM